MSKQFGLTRRHLGEDFGFNLVEQHGRFHFKHISGILKTKTYVSNGDQLVEFQGNPIEDYNMREIQEILKEEFSGNGRLA